MRVAVVTLFPEMVMTVARFGVTARAVERGLLGLDCWNPRDYARDRHRRVDDRPYGGGPGMGEHHDATPRGHHASDFAADRVGRLVEQERPFVFVFVGKQGPRRGGSLELLDERRRGRGEPNR